MVSAITLFLVTFVSIFMRGHQTQYVVQGKYLGAFLNSWLMAFANVAMISLVATSGWDALLPAGLGSSLGIVSSMYIFRKTHKSKSKDAKCL